MCSCVFVLCFYEVGRWAGDETKKTTSPLTLFFDHCAFSYQPVEFSRRTLPPISLSLWEERDGGEGGVLFLLCGSSVLIQKSLHSFKPSQVSRALLFGMITHSKKNKVLLNIKAEPPHSLSWKHKRLPFILTPHPLHSPYHNKTSTQSTYEALWSACLVPVVPEMCFEVVKKQNKKQSCIKNEACFICVAASLSLTNQTVSLRIF